MVAWPGWLMHRGLEDPMPAMVPTKKFQRHKNHTSPLTPVRCSHADKATPAKATPARAAPELHRQVGREVDGGPPLAAGSPFALGRPQRALQRCHLQHGGCAARWVARPAMAAVWEAAGVAAAAAGWSHGRSGDRGAARAGSTATPLIQAIPRAGVACQRRRPVVPAARRLAAQRLSVPSHAHTFTTRSAGSKRGQRQQGRAAAAGCPPSIVSRGRRCTKCWYDRNRRCWRARGGLALLMRAALDETASRRACTALVLAAAVGNHR